MPIDRSQQLRDLEESIAEDRKLLKAIQNAERYEENPKTKLKYQKQIQEIRERIEQSEREYESISSRIQSNVLEQNITSDADENRSPEVKDSSQTSSTLTQPAVASRMDFQDKVGGVAGKVQGNQYINNTYYYSNVSTSSPEVKVTPKQLQNFVEDLGYGVELEMIAIPKGHFLMGSPGNEQGWSCAESPRHYVKIAPFYIGKYPVTQAQWWMVVDLPKVNLDLNLEPSLFKGANLPVEMVSWYEATEFCQRLSKRTGREYRLPSEAEWEYACRAGTTTPFHFGKTITANLANYDSNYTSGGSVGRFPASEQTTPVGSFPANDFGLHDMHGNVWEWCADHWHNNYEGAPIDGNIWLSSNETADRVIRGGCWSLSHWNCRSACRNRTEPNNWSPYLGFRVCCVPIKGLVIPCSCCPSPLIPLEVVGMVL